MRQSRSKLVTIEFIFQCTIGIEDEMNWHGKALGDKAQAAIAQIEGVMSDKNGPYKVTRPPVVDDAQHFAPETVVLSEPPSYKLGDKVCRFKVNVGRNMVIENTQNREITDQSLV